MPETPINQITVKLTPGNTQQKAERIAPDPQSRQTGKEEPIAYVFKDKNLGELPVLNSANAWWLDPTKLDNLIAAYKFYATDEQACYYAGISLRQLLYFQELHPDFYAIKHAAKQHPTLIAKQTMVNGVNSDRFAAGWWLERVEKENFSTRQEQTGPNGTPLHPEASESQKKLTNAAIEEFLNKNKPQENGTSKPTGANPTPNSTPGSETEKPAGNSA